MDQQPFDLAIMQGGKSITWLKINSSSMPCPIWKNPLFTRHFKWYSANKNITEFGQLLKDRELMHFYELL